MTVEVMSMLRDGTQELHTAAERQAFQRALVRGDLSLGAYTGYLEQMLLVHSALESRLAGASDASLCRVVGPQQFQAPNLRADLQTLGGNSDPRPLPATADLLARLASCTDAAALLGHLYVLEGSKNGAAFIARAVRRSLGVQPGQGDRFLDPHGETQRPVWAAFKARVDAEPWTPRQRDDMLAAAREMFAAIAAISADLEAQHLSASV